MSFETLSEFCKFGVLPDNPGKLIRINRISCDGYQRRTAEYSLFGIMIFFKYILQDIRATNSCGVRLIECNNKRRDSSLPRFRLPLSALPLPTYT